MDPRTLARVLAYGRIGLGGALLLAPGLVGRAWLGRDGGRPGTKVAAAGLGVRDLVIGAGVLNALGDATGARPWLQAAAAADAVDFVATWRARDELPALGALGVAAVAGSAAALGLWLQRELA